MMDNLQEKTDAVIREACAKISAAIREAWRGPKDLQPARRGGSRRHRTRGGKVRI